MHVGIRIVAVGARIAANRRLRPVVRITGAAEVGIQGLQVALLFDHLQYPRQGAGMEQTMLVPHPDELAPDMPQDTIDLVLDDPEVGFVPNVAQRAVFLRVVGDGRRVVRRHIVEHYHLDAVPDLRRLRHHRLERHLQVMRALVGGDADGQERGRNVIRH